MQELAVSRAARSPDLHILRESIVREWPIIMQCSLQHIVETRDDISAHLAERDRLPRPSPSIDGRGVRAHNIHRGNRELLDYCNIEFVRESGIGIASTVRWKVYTRP